MKRGVFSEPVIAALAPVSHCFRTSDSGELPLLLPLLLLLLPSTLLLLTVYSLVAVGWCGCYNEAR